MYIFLLTHTLAGLNPLQGSLLLQAGCLRPLELSPFLAGTTFVHVLSAKKSQALIFQAFGRISIWSQDQGRRPKNGATCWLLFGVQSASLRTRRCPLRWSSVRRGTPELRQHLGSQKDTNSKNGRRRCLSFPQGCVIGVGWGGCLGVPLKKV